MRSCTSNTSASSSAIWGSSGKRASHSRTRLERTERVGKLAQRDRAISRTASVIDRRPPLFGKPEVMCEHVRMFIDELGISALDRSAHSAVQRAPLVPEQAVVGHLVREHMFEAICGFRHQAGLLDQARCLQALQRGGRLGALSHGIDQQGLGEITSDDRMQCAELRATRRRGRRDARVSRPAPYPAIAAPPRHRRRRPPRRAG